MSYRTCADYTMADRVGRQSTHIHTYALMYVDMYSYSQFRCRDYNELACHIPYWLAGNWLGLVTDSVT